MSDLISTEQRGAVAVITIDNPPLNALTTVLLGELERTVARLDDDPGTRAIVLRGAGEKAFVAGANIKEFPAILDADPDAGPAQALIRLGHRIEAGRTPFVVAIHGYCLGGGLELAMCCDVRVCADDAVLGQPEIKLGLIPGGGGTQRLPRLVGRGRALLLNLGGDPIDARTAYDWGLVEKVVPRADLLEAAVGIAETFASRSPYAIAAIRELSRTTRELSLEEGLRREAEAFRRCLASDDGKEGVAAFIEKRPPTFGGG